MTHRQRILRAVLCWALLGAASGVHAAQEDPFAGVEITTTEIAPGLHVLEGAGGNIAVLSGPDGMLMVDDQYAPLSERIQAALDAIAPGGPRFVLNTHYHGDHTGGNAFFARSGTLVAHENVRIRLAGDDGFDAAGLPGITFDDRIRFHVNGEVVDVVHLPAGHTDGDSVVFFRNANVVHMGDHLFDGVFPYVDLAAGGTVRGMLRNLDHVLEQIDDDTRVISGHGKAAVVDAAAIESSALMIRSTLSRVRRQLADGTSPQAILDEGVEPRWKDWSWRFIDEDRWLRTLLTELGQPLP